MIKILTSLYIVFILSMPVIGQNAKVVLYGENSCGDKVKQLFAFGLEKDGVTYSITDSTGILRLKQLGQYVLSYTLSDIDTTQLGRLYNITEHGVFSDTLILNTIYSCLNPTSHPDFIGYCCCDEKCEGDQVDYYANGNKRISGYFEEGKPIGILKTYYPNSQLKQLDKYTKKGRLKKRVYYDENGCIVKKERF